MAKPNPMAKTDKIIPLKPDKLGYSILNLAEVVLIPNAQVILQNRGPDYG